MANQFPGLEDVIKFLQDQAATQGKPTPPTILPSGQVVLRPGGVMSNQIPVTGSNPSTMGESPGGGIFNAAEGSGGAFARKALGGLARGALGAMLPVPGTGKTLGGLAWNAGQQLAGIATGSQQDENGQLIKNDSPRGMRNANARKFEGSSLPSVEQITGQPLKVQSLQSPVIQKRQQQQPNPIAYSAQLAGVDVPDHEDNHEQVQPSAEPTAQGVDVPAQYDDTPEEQTAEEVSSQSAQTEAQQVMAAISKQLDEKVAPPVQESPDEESTQAVSDLTKESGPEPKETFGHKVKRFFVAGSGPLNFNRIDDQEAATKQAKSKFTDPQALRGDLAADDIKGSRKFNREAQLKQQDTGGLNDREKLKMGTLLEQYKLASGDERLTKQLQTEHTNKMGELAAAGANQKLSPEVMKNQALYKQMEQYPDMFSPEIFKSAFGVDVSPQALKVISDARLKNDPLAMVTAEILKDRMDKMKGAKGTDGKPNLAIKSLSK